MMNWNYIVIGLSLLLLAFVCWKEIGRTNRSRLVLRLAASVLVIVSLACMALPFSIIKKTKVQTRANEAILLTEGYNKDSVETFIKKNHEDITLYKQDSIAWIDTSLTTLHVFGYGLTDDEFNLLKNIPVVFHPSIINDGITAIHFNQKLKSGEKLTIQGTFTNTKPGPVTISLDGFNTTLDSMIIPGKKTGTFELNTIPKHVGKAVYSLVVSNKEAVLETEPIPVEVNAADTLKILLLAASPGFENKFLRNWIAENRYSVVSSTRISKNKYDKLFINLPIINFDKITKGLLGRFDILISDATELAALTTAELSAIRQQVQEESMGLIVKADSIEVASAFYAAPFTQYPTAGRQQVTAVLYLKDAVKPTAPLINEGQSYIRYKTGTQPLVLDSSSNILVNSSMEGSGKILFTTISNTYTWMLAGNRSGYYSYWSFLLQKAAKRTGSQQSLLTGNAMAKVDEPVKLIFESQDDLFFQPVIDNAHLSLHQNPDLPFEWNGVYWPEKPGWQPAIHLAGQQLQWFAYNSNNWKNISAIEKTNQTFAYIKYKNNTAKKFALSSKYTRSELPPYFYLLIFIVCCSFLWIEKKLSPS